MKKRSRYVGAAFDLYGAANQERAARGLRDGFLTEDELRALCASIIRHAERLKLVLTIGEETRQ